MKNVTAQLTKYAAYHRDRRNIATHFVGIPLIVIALEVLLYGLHPFVAYAATLAVMLFYLRLDPRLGLATTGLYVAGLALAESAKELWLPIGLGLFVLGWVLQFIGHWFEGRKPAFTDDLIGLAVGPMFVITEGAFMLGMRRSLQEAIEAKVGPTRIRPRGAATAAR